MRHRMHTRQLGRSSPHRKAMYRNMVTSLLEHERIETTDAKAKELRRLAERMITLGKRGDLHARRRALRMIRSRDVAAKVFDDRWPSAIAIAPGGYTRVLKLRPPRAATPRRSRSSSWWTGRRRTALSASGRPRRRSRLPPRRARRRPRPPAAEAKRKAAKPAAKPAAAKKRSAKPAADAKGKARKASPRKRGSTKSPG